MIKVLHNSRSDLYLNLKKEILGKNFPWFYQEKTTTKNIKYDGHKNVSIFGHNFLNRPEDDGYSKVNSEYFPYALNAVKEILSENGFVQNSYFFLRLNANCSFPDEGVQFTNPHTDHSFKHLNFLIYLTDNGGKTFVEGEEHEPSEDDVILFTGEHYFELPKKGRRIVIIATLFTI